MLIIFIQHLIVCNTGMYANDLAYYDGTTEEVYNRNSPDLNVLQIAWRMELQNQVGKIIYKISNMLEE